LIVELINVEKVIVFFYLSGLYLSFKLAKYLKDEMNL